MEPREGVRPVDWNKAFKELAERAQALDDKVGNHLETLPPGTPREAQKEFWDSIEKEAKTISDTLASYRTGQTRSDADIDASIQLIKNKINPFLKKSAE